MSCGPLSAAMPQFSLRTVLTAFLLVAVVVGIGVRGEVGMLASISLALAFPVIGITYLTIRKEQASWAIWLALPILAGVIFWFLGSWYADYVRS
jgi:hypothetical protein